MDNRFLRVSFVEARLIEKLLIIIQGSSVSSAPYILHARILPSWFVMIVYHIYKNSIFFFFVD